MILLKQTMLAMQNTDTARVELQQELERAGEIPLGLKTAIERALAAMDHASSQLYQVGCVLIDESRGISKE